MGTFIQAVDGTKIYVEDIGSGQPVVMLHGWPANNNMFEYQKNRLLEEGYRYIGVDYRGYGKSDAPATGYDYTTMASDINEVIQQLKLTNVTLLGFSMGGGIALKYLLNHGESNVSKLILAGAAAPVFTQRDGYPYGMTKDEVDALIEDTKQDRPSMLKGFGEIFFAKEHPEPLQQWFHNLSVVASSHGTIQSAIALRDEDLRDGLPKITVDTLIMHGKKDQVCPFEFAEVMHENIAGSRLEVFEESGHGMFLDEREKFTETLVSYVKSSQTV
ncbi:alpha/beta hydrolase [Exiguobacterium sp. KRL4]|uniref:alpha/beta fold hydrolase n=1 Tax=Exiguobacterium sp. KRL4 TaxID=1914536 RepID=UPI0008F89808|nr:alpha/beta hydrolase [Exiguobacterium sp. KRL4]OIN66561.1 alpha/beta hydrolase [Exiguobacterium sp. KRL4]